MRQIIMGRMRVRFFADRAAACPPLRTSSKSESRLCIISHSSMGVSVAPSLRENRERRHRRLK